jgi:hypothetical protein
MRQTKKQAMKPDLAGKRKARGKKDLTEETIKEQSGA